MKATTLVGILVVWLLIGGLASFMIMGEDASAPMLQNRESEVADVDRPELVAPATPILDIPETGTPKTVEPTIEEEAVSETTEKTKIVAEGETTIDSDKSVSLADGKVVDSIHIRGTGGLTLAAGTVQVVNDLKVSTAVKAGSTTLQLTGDGEITGNIAANKIEVTAGTRRLTKGTRLSSTRTGNAAPGQEGFYVALGATVIIEEGASVHTSAAYGFRIDGTLIIDGGSFNCTFTNGNGKTTNRCWGESSRLEVRQGVFHGGGDASFGGAALAISGGKIHIQDDLWDTGKSLDMSGGSIENRRYGGQFSVTGNVLMTGGELLVHASSRRGLYFPKSANFIATGGKVVLYGGTLRFDASTALNDVEIQKSASIHASSNKEATLYINGSMTFVKGASFNTGAYNVLIAGMTADKGVFTPEEYQLVDPRITQEKLLPRFGQMPSRRPTEGLSGGRVIELQDDEG
ncbi:hypothetical protein OAU50_05410 [Planctomycetota bacterium]|nr:hypothetical protein [Planctomycetota bacterium]